MSTKRFRTYRATAAAAGLFLAATALSFPGARAAAVAAGPQAGGAPASGGGGGEEPKQESPKGPAVTLDVRNADVRTVLTDLFRQAKVKNYTIANDVTGYVTLKVTDRPLEDVLGLVCRTAAPPLRFRKTPEGVYEVRVRSYGNTGSASGGRVAAAAPPTPSPGEAPASDRAGDWEAITLMYAEADGIVEAMNTLQPDGVTRMIAYLPTNLLLVKGGDPAVEGFRTVIIGGGARGSSGAPGTPGAGGGAGSAGAGAGGGPVGGGSSGGRPTGGGGAANP